MIGHIKSITYRTAIDFLLPRHYSGRKPQVKYAFGWYIEDELSAVCTFGKPASNTLCDGICGKEHSSKVYELNRLCRLDAITHPISAFVAECLRRLSVDDLIIVSYADTGMGHGGYVYQALNFIYTGCTKQRLEFYVEKGHSRHGSKDSSKRKIRTAKHRYVYFATKNRRLKKELKNSLRYPIHPYPKPENRRYTLGEYQQPTVVPYIRKQK